jgi:oligoendopeptidase F
MQSFLSSNLMKGNSMRRFASAVCLAVILLVVQFHTYGQERDRSKIPDKYKWNIAEIYPNDDAWKKAKAQLIADIAKLERFRGKVTKSPQDLLACLDGVTQLGKEYARLSVYAQLISDQDTRDSKRLAMQQEMGQVGSSFGAATSFVEPEILKSSKSDIDGFVNKEKKLEVYRHYLDDLLRRQAHTGTENEEKIIADAGLIAGSPQNIYSTFSNADFPYPTVTLSDGKEVKLDKAAFNVYRAVPNREDRRKVFATYFASLGKFKGTFGTQTYAEVSKNMFFAKARKYDSAIRSALDASNIPVQVYRRLVENVNANLETFHRYLKLRKRIMGVDELHYYDLYAPLVANADLQYTPEEAEKNILAALVPLGNDYVATLKKALNERWIDLYPTEGKRAGAYSQGGAYDVHPYMLLNYNGKYVDMSTLAHELGHTLQSYLSNKKQPYPTASYPTFVAEVASTFNEALLIDYMLKSIKDDNVRLSLLGNYLEGIKATLFRQTQFAEFELRMHEMAERGESLTGDGLDALYAEITRKYYGHDKGVCIIDDEVKAEWAHIPHFYYNFYVYQYATSFTASAALSEQVLAGDQAATKRYLEFLSAGGSDYPINLLKNAGVDMTTSQPFELSMKKMNKVMDEMERILNKTKS